MKLYPDSTMMEKVPVVFNDETYYIKAFVTYAYSFKEPYKNYDIPENPKRTVEDVIEVAILNIYHVDKDGLFIKDSIDSSTDIHEYIHDNKKEIFLKFINC